MVIDYGEGYRSSEPKTKPNQQKANNHTPFACFKISKKNKKWGVGKYQMTLAKKKKKEPLS